MMTGSTAFVAEIQALKEQNKLLCEALEDIYRHSSHPFVGHQWNKYAHEISYAALKQSNDGSTDAG